MEKRICWKKGMRLTDDIMRGSDEATAHRISNALALASAGRFGLLPGPRQFQLSLNLKPDAVEILTLDCLAVTRGGLLIDVQIDTKYTNYLEKRIDIPFETEEGELFLTISVDTKRWKETTDGYEEPEYTFRLVGVNSPLPDNALPIAHLVRSSNESAWHIDEENFVPPCLFVSSHWNYVDLLNQFVQRLTEVESKVFQLLQPGSHETFRILWPVVQQILIDTDKRRDTLTPLEFLGNIQKFVAIFTSACHIDQGVIFSDANLFRSFALAPYDYMNVYPMIKEGLKYSFLIDEKIDKIETKQPETPKMAKGKLEAPAISENYLYMNCKTSAVSIPVINNAPGSTVYYSYDGSEPSKPSSNGKIRIKNTFNSVKEPEPDQEFQVKLKSATDDAESEVVTFNIILHKDYKIWIKI